MPTAQPTFLAALTDNIPLPTGISKDVIKQVEDALPVIKEIPANVGHRLTDFGTDAAIAIIIVLGGWLAARWIMKHTHRTLTRAKVNETPAQFLASAARFVIILTAFIMAIIQLGVPTKSLWAVLGALTLAIGLGLKDTLTNVAAGIMLLINRPFEVADYIQIAELQGIVKRIGLFQTEINTRDNIRIAFPNQTIWNSPIINHTHNRVRMIEYIVGLSYDHTTADCLKAIEAAIGKEPLILKEPTPFLGVDALADNAVNYIIRVWVRTSDYPTVKYSLLGRIKAEVDARGIGIPYPQRVVHMAPSAPTPRKKRR